jgi:iron complex outermembrane receptor protein
MKKIYISFLGLLISLSTMAQSGQLSGKVFDGVDKRPLVNAHVQFIGGAVTTTDSNGEFALPCTGAGSISVSFVGYRTVRNKVGELQ